MAGHEQAVGASREALTGAVAEQRELEQGQRGAAEAVESHAQRASRLQAELLAAKEKVDLAQVRPAVLSLDTEAASLFVSNDCLIVSNNCMLRPAGIRWI